MSVAVLCIKFSQIKDLILKISKSTTISSLSDFQLDIIVGLICAALSALFGIMIKAIKNSVSIPSYIKHKSFPLLQNFSKNSDYNTKQLLLNKSINQFFNYEFVSNDKQNSIENKISEKILSDNNEILWLTGTSCTGKTLAIENTLVSFLTNNSYYSLFKEIDNKVRCIDFHFSKYNEFIKDYNKGRYQNDLLIIDNITSLSSATVLDLLNTLTKSTPKTKLLIVCLREYNEITNDGFLSSLIHSKIIGTGEIISLQNNLFKFGSMHKHIPNNKLNYIKDMTDSQKVHFINMLNISGKNKIFCQIEQYILGAEKTNLYHRVIYYISAFSIFKGCFSTKELLSVFPLKNRLHVELLIDQLYSAGFIIRSIYGFDDFYILNEKISRYYFKKGYKIFSSISKQIFEKQFKFYMNENSYCAFLYNCFLNPKKLEQQTLFNNIAFNTNFEVLLNDLLFVKETLINPNYNYEREFGILYDRTGRIEKSRSEFKKLLSNSLSKNDTEAAVDTYYRLVQINHEEYNNYHFLQDYKSSSHYLNICKKYWEIHIKMHKGIFLYNEQIELLKHSAVLCKEPVNYDNIHLLRRIYFDTFRIYYLVGTMDDKLIEINEAGKEIELYLRNNLNEFGMYNTKFSTLFLLINDIIFNFVLDNTIVDKSIFNNYLNDTNLSYSSMSDITVLLNESISICEQLEKSFYNAGDKTFNFIKYYKAELLIAENSPIVLSLIKEYSDFGKDEIEYRVYSDFITLKYWLARLTDVDTIEHGDDNYTKETKQNIRKNIESLNKYFEQGYVNDYAYTRLKIYSLLFDIINKDAKINDVIELLDFVNDKKYFREIKLLNVLKESKLKKPFLWYRNIILFYPIVPQ